MLFGNNMSWLYGKLKKKLDAPATAGSAGDVLTLGESGKPEWAEGGGSGGGGVVQITVTPVEGTDNFALDKTYAEISSALESGSFCYAVYYNEFEGMNAVIIVEFYRIGTDPETEDPIYVVDMSDAFGYFHISFTSAAIDGTLTGKVQS